MAEKKTFDLSSIIGQVSKMDTASAAAVALPIDGVHPNEHNFYDVSSVDSLVDSILLDGLQSPLVVSQRTEDDYVIISGHRRFKALQKIREGGLHIPEDKLFAADINAGKVPCLVNRYGSELEAELALIRANSDTRVLSSAEISRQAERVEMLLYELKGQGYEFPGKMRDYVAQACQVSASKLARLKVIREKLIAPYLKEFNAQKPGAINETVAYELAQLSEDDQHWIYSANIGLTTGSAAHMAKQIKTLKAAKCKDGSPCHQARTRFDHYTRNGNYAYMPCNYSVKCCRECSYIMDCKAICPDCEELVKDKKAAERAAKKAENARIRDQQKRDTDRSVELIGRMHIAMDRAGVDEKQTCKAAGLYYYEGRLNMPEKPTPSSAPISREHLDELCAVADLCKCSTDFLLCRTDIPYPPDELTKKVDAATDAPDAWRTDTDYPFDCWIVVNGLAGPDLYYHKIDGFYLMSDDNEPIHSLHVRKWLPLPSDVEVANDGR